MTATVWRAVVEFTDDAGVLHTREVPCVRGIDISQSGTVTLTSKDLEPLFNCPMARIRRILFPDAQVKTGR